MAKKLEDYTPVVKYHGLQTDKAVVFGSTLAVTGAITATGGVSGAVGGAVAATTLSSTGATSLAETNFKRQVTDTGGAFATPIVLTEAQSGRVIIVDDAAGLDFTLPAIAAAQIGTHYKFVVTVSVSSNSLRITAATGDLLFGALPILDFDTANTVTYFAPDGNDLIITCNGTTTGGKQGSWIELIASSATQWLVTGMLFGDGTLATPFS